MARHLMAVCVVCLLCADHLPCKQHFEETAKTQNFIPDVDSRLVAGQRFVDTLHLPASRPLAHDTNAFDNAPYLINRRRGRTKRMIDADVADDSIVNDIHLQPNTPQTTRRLRPNKRAAVLRTKRHAGGHGHHHHDETEAETNPSDNFVRLLFERFGDGNAGTMDVLQFERMMEKIGLYWLHEHDKTNTNKTVANATEPDQCISSMELVSRVSSETPRTTPHTESTSRSHANNATNVTNGTSPNHNPSNNLSGHAGDESKQQTLLNSHDLTAICPILLYQLTSDTSLGKSGCIDPQLIAEDFGSRHLHHNERTERQPEDRTLVWVYAMAAILIASLCGLLAVVVIPCMESAYYHYLLQFFVALGVGTLAGDALLHLLPHAMMTTNKHEDPHVTMTLKGLAAAAGVVFFFLTERALTMVGEWRKRRQKKDKPSSRVRVMRDPDTASVHDPKTEKLCKAKYSSYPYCYDEIDMETKDDHHHHHNHEPTGALSTAGKAPPSPIASLNNHNNHHSHNHNNHQANNHKASYKTHEHNDYLDTAQSLLATPNNYSISDNYVALQHCKNVENGAGGDAAPSAQSPNGGDHSIVPRETENYTIILREHEAKHHGHSHKHGHVHSPPSSLSAVAWMVIMGDGLHNFTDGMAIGVAFSMSIAGGFSTALAVFCHELPHELGDFAILLKAGMSAKQAVYYNVLSSVLSFIGTFIGIWIGEMPDASSWVFACAAGMFLYIAMVDMMPELTSSHKEESFAFTQLLLQLVGMMLGVGIMLLIAIYEEDLKLIFTANASAN